MITVRSTTWRIDNGSADLVLKVETRIKASVIVQLGRTRATSPEGKSHVLALRLPGQAVKPYYDVTVTARTASGKTHKRKISATPHGLYPEPARIGLIQAGLTIQRTAKIQSAVRCVSAARILQDELRRLANTRSGYTVTARGAGRIRLKLRRDLIPAGIASGEKRHFTREGYHISVTPTHATVAAPALAGLRNGIHALLDMATIDSQGRLFLWQGEIWDWPDVEYRGVLVDPARHYFTPERLEEQVRFVARSRINRFHVHFVDDQVGFTPSFENIPGLEKGERTDCYTVDEMRKLDTVATDHGVTVVPEIYIHPGRCHNMGLLRLRPDLLLWGKQRSEGCYQPVYEFATVPEVEVAPGKDKNTFVLRMKKGGPSGPHICPGQERYWLILEKVMEEAASIFRSEYIHLGLDETGWQWQKCPHCRRKFDDLGHPAKKWKKFGAAYLSMHFLQRGADILKKHGKKPMIWNDRVIIDKDNPKATPLPPETAITWWSQQHPGRKTSRKSEYHGYYWRDKNKDMIYTPSWFMQRGHNVVNSCNRPMYVGPMWRPSKERCAFQRTYGYDSASGDGPGFRMVHFPRSDRMLGCMMSYWWSVYDDGPQELRSVCWWMWVPILADRFWRKRPRNSMDVACRLLPRKVFGPRVSPELGAVLLPFLGGCWMDGNSTPAICRAIDEHIQKKDSCGIEFLPDLKAALKKEKFYIRNEGDNPFPQGWWGDDKVVPISEKP